MKRTAMFVQFLSYPNPLYLETTFYPISLAHNSKSKTPGFLYPRRNYPQKSLIFYLFIFTDFF